MTRLLLTAFALLLATGSFAGRSGQDADKIARALADRLFESCIAARLREKGHPDHELRLVVDTRKGAAYIMVMGHELFRMKARYVDISPPGLSIADNWMELQGNTNSKLYLDLAKKLLFFRETDGRTNPFARVAMEPPLSAHTRHLLIMKIRDHHPITFYIGSKRKNKKKTRVHFKGHELFVMHARKIRIKGSGTPIYQLKYKKAYKDGIYFNPSRKILYFRSGITGVFAKVDVAGPGECVMDITGSVFEIERWSSD